MAAGKTDEDVPAIHVIADGGWSMRSHQHRYSAKSGVAVIIGERTKKLLYLGVRNKFCSINVIAANKAKILLLKASIIVKRCTATLYWARSI